MRTFILFALVACRADPDDYVGPKDGISDPDTAVESDTDTDTDADTDADTDTDTDTDTAPPEDADGDAFSVDQGDCDDADATVHPGADERCDGIDQDCDGLVDEGVTGTFYADADGDGHGAPGTATDTCEGAVETDDDCDDSRADVYPLAPELCDDVDNDCDGAVDEEGLSTWYTDADADGFGDVTTGVLDCGADGRVADRTDCDDADSAVFPGAEEVCNGTDDNCDGVADEGVSATWYIDYDADGYGSDAYTRSSCTAPSGYVASDDDCDDTEAAVNPAAAEVCNAVDDNCDGTVDEDAAVDAPTWYFDGDGDTWGDSVLFLAACEGPSGYVPDDGDCDDTDASTYPGAPERYDGVDDDCDGTIDDNTWIGTGADGSLVVTGTTDLSVDASGARTVADGVAYAVTGLGADTVTLDAAPSGIAAGDEVLILNLQGSSSAYASVGTYEFAWVSATTPTTVTLDDALTQTFGEVSNSDLTGQTVVMVRVPQYEDVTIGAGGLLTAGAWTGSTGGVLAFRATGTVSIEAGGAVALDEAGYAGGSTGSAYNNDAFSGESYAGEGCGDAPSGSPSYNAANGCYANNQGGGGAHVTGGGGEYGGGATAGASWDGGYATAPEPGDTYGDIDLSTLFLGSGGGGVWHGASYPGSGGAGGGIVYIGASVVTADGGEAITALGESPSAWATGSWTYGAAGGAGGSVWIVADTLTLAVGAVDAQGGLGESTHIRAGGDGGAGRVRLDCQVINGVDCAVAAGVVELDAAAEPDAGWVATP